MSILDRSFLTIALIGLTAVAQCAATEPFAVTAERCGSQNA
jgi:hypothetical protein